MKHPLFLGLLAGCGFLGSVALVGCAGEDAPQARQAESAPKQLPASKKVEVGKNVHLEIQGERRRVLVSAYVCLRRGMLEEFLTRKRTKEHESLLAADLDARDIHTALTLARAEPGHPVRFLPKYEPATGTPIQITLEYQEKGQLVQVPAQKWIRSSRTKKDLTHSWVFAGSVLFPDPLDKTKKPFYAANDGDVISISNFDTALLDLPITSTRDNDDLAFEAHTERIPPENTPVLVILEPMFPQAKKK